MTNQSLLYFSLLNDFLEKNGCKLIKYKNFEQDLAKREIKKRIITDNTINGLPLIYELIKENSIIDNRKRLCEIELMANQKLDLLNTRTISMKHEDFISGSLVYCNFLLRTNPTSFIEKKSKKILSRYKILGSSHHQVPYATQPFESNYQDFLNFPRGHIRVGLAHGIAGFLDFYSNLFLYNGNKKLLIYIEPIVETLLSFCDVTSDCFWPAKVSLDDMVSYDLKKNKHIHQHSWCYGTAGICYALLSTSRVPGYEFLYQKVLSILKKLENLSVLELGFDSYDFCHGLGGFLLFLKILVCDFSFFELEGFFIRLKNIVETHVEKRLNSFDFSQIESDQLGNIFSGLISEVLVSLALNSSNYYRIVKKLFFPSVS